MPIDLGRQPMLDYLIHKPRERDQDQTPVAVAYHKARRKRTERRSHQAFTRQPRAQKRINAPHRFG